MEHKHQNVETIIGNTTDVWESKKLWMLSVNKYHEEQETVPETAVQTFLHVHTNNISTFYESKKKKYNFGSS